jgi:hypothetical protein
LCNTLWAFDGVVTRATHTDEVSWPSITNTIKFFKQRFNFLFGFHRAIKQDGFIAAILACSATLNRPGKP